VDAYSYPAPGEPRPHGVTSICGGVITLAYPTLPMIGSQSLGTTGM
jgi:hypothetical protein